MKYHVSDANDYFVLDKTLFVMRNGLFAEKLFLLLEGTSAAEGFGTEFDFYPDVLYL